MCCAASPVLAVVLSRVVVHMRRPGQNHRASQRGVCVCLLGWGRIQQAVCAVVDAVPLSWLL